jgi:RNA polymerase sigma-70 factor, ECF subfamily
MDLAQQFYQYSEENLVKKASSGDLDAFNQLVLMYQDLAYHYAFALLKDAGLAQDAAQDSFIRGFQNIAGFRGGSFRAWILKIVKNSAYDALRRLKRHPMQPLFPEDDNGDEMESPAWITDTTALVEDTVEQKESSENLYQLLDELPDVFRTVLTLVDIYELDYAEAASALNVPIGTVKSRLARARLQMSEKLRRVENRQFCLYSEA